MIIDGWGELRYYTGDVYQGAWKDGLRQGKVIKLGMILVTKKLSFNIAVRSYQQKLLHVNINSHDVVMYYHIQYTHHI